MARFAPVPRLLSLLIGASLLPCGAAASEPEPLMTLVVEGSGERASPLGTSVDVAPLRATTSDAASLLRDVPGVSLYGAGGVSSLPAIHGLADDRLRIKVDGMDLIAACGNHMNPPLSYIDPSAVAEATVFTGVAPVSVGGDSIGGSIVVESAAPEFAASGALLHKGEAGAFYRSNGDAFGANVAATLASETLSLSYRASSAQADDYHAGDSFKPGGPAAAGRGWLDGDEVGSTMYKSRNQALMLATRRDDQRVELKVGVQQIPYQGFPNQRMDMTGNESTQLSLRYTDRFNWGQLEARAYREDTRHTMQFFDDKLYWYGATPAVDGMPCVPTGGATGCAAGMPMETEGHNRGALVKASLPLSNRDLLRVGGEAQQYRLDDWWDPSGKGMWPDVFWNINGGERDRLAMFGEWEARWTPLWMTQLGVRYERVDMDTGDVQGYNATYDADAAAFNAADRDKTDHNVDLTTLVRHVPDAGKTFEFGYARKTRSPNLYERYTWSTGGMAMRMINWFGDGNGYVGNVDLEPEIAHTLAATADWHASDARWGFKLTPYITYVDDYINAARLAAQPTPDGFVYLRFVNQDALLYGVDVSGHLPLVKSTRFGELNASAIIGYVHGETLSGEDDTLYNLMPLNAKLAVTQRLAAWRNTAEVLLVDAKDEVSDIHNEIETSGYALLNLRSSYQWKQARLDVGVENVFDRYYEHPLGGAYVGQGKTMPATGVPWGVAVPGMGRSLYTAVTFTF